MSSDLFRRGLVAYRAALAEDLGCEPVDFESNDLVVVERPADSREKYIAVLATFGTGTVLSVAPDYMEFVRALPPARKHYISFAPTVVVAPVAEEAIRRGEVVAPRGPNLGFLLNEAPAEPAIPAGLRIARVDREWRDRYAPDGHFGNALAEPDDPPEVVAMWRYALALMDESDEPTAIAGAYDDRGGFLEVGLDVAKAHRGQGLAPIVVATLVRDILANDRLPTYFCAPTNIRSQHTALACGFAPAASMAVVRRK